MKLSTSEIRALLAQDHSVSRRKRPIRHGYPSPARSFSPVHIDAATRSSTTSQETYYVAISRARHEARIYTDDLARLPAAVSRERAKHAALDLERR